MRFDAQIMASCNAVVVVPEEAGIFKAGFQPAETLIAETREAAYPQEARTDRWDLNWYPPAPAGSAAAGGVVLWALIPGACRDASAGVDRGAPGSTSAP